MSGDGTQPSPFPTLYAFAKFALLVGAAHAACPGAAAPGSYCVGAVETQCPVGAWCAGGALANAPCYPAAACAVGGLSAQPPCYWNMTTLAGNGTRGFTDGVGGGVMFNQPRFAAFNGSSLLIADNLNKRVRRVDTATGATTTLWTAPSSLSGLAFDGSGALYILPVNGNVSKYTDGTSISMPCDVGAHPNGISFINSSYGFWFTKCVFCARVFCARASGKPHP